MRAFFLIVCHVRQQGIPQLPNARDHVTNVDYYHTTFNFMLLPSCCLEFEAITRAFGGRIAITRQP